MINITILDFINIVQQYSEQYPIRSRLGVQHKLPQRWLKESRLSTPCWAHRSRLVRIWTAEVSVLLKDNESLPSPGVLLCC